MVWSFLQFRFRVGRRNCVPFIGQPVNGHLRGNKGVIRSRSYNYKRQRHWIPDQVLDDRGRAQGTHSARNTLNSSGLLALRSEIHTSSLPSGENMGKLLKCPSKVICSKPVPSSLTMCR